MNGELRRLLTSRSPRPSVGLPGRRCHSLRLSGQRHLTRRGLLITEISSATVHSSVSPSPSSPSHASSRSLCRQVRVTVYGKRGVTHSREHILLSSHALTRIRGTRTRERRVRDSVGHIRDEQPQNSPSCKEKIEIVATLLFECHSLLCCH